MQIYSFPIVYSYDSLLFMHCTFMEIPVDRGNGHKIPATYVVSAIPALALTKALCYTEFDTIGPKYHQASNISSTLVGSTIVDHPDVGAASTTSSFWI